MNWTIKIRKINNKKIDSDNEGRGSGEMNYGRNEGQNGMKCKHVNKRIVKDRFYACGKNLTKWLLHLIINT